MRKYILLCSIVVFTACGKFHEEPWIDDSEIIEFKDPKFLQAILSLDEELYRIDKNSDGQISEKEASIITTLIINNGIRDIEEIKYFTSLEQLNCDDNQLTTLNMSGCTALKLLNCNRNEHLTSLDVSKNSALLSLSCANEWYWQYYGSSCELKSDGRLTSLDVSTNTALTDLNCSGNKLISLDLNKNTALEFLDCRANQCKTLDISNNKALKSLDCMGNQLTSLDVSKNIALTWLDCSENQLVTLDLSKNTSLERLSCEKNPLTKILLSKYNMINDDDIKKIQNKYGDIIEYVE